MNDIIKQKIARILRNENVKFRVYMRWSIALSILTAIFKISVGLIIDSAWFLFAGVYYAFLCGARIFLKTEYKRLSHITNAKEHILRAFRDYRITGLILMLLTFPYLLMCVRMFIFNDCGKYVVFIASASSIIAAIKLTLALVGVFRTKSLSSPINTAAKRINFCDALVSISVTQAALSALFCNGRYTPFSLICGIGTGIITFVLGAGMFNRTLKRKK